MNDEKKVDGLRITVATINVILMAITVILQLLEFNALRHVILCSCILMLISVELVLDGILKDRKSIFVHSFWYVSWLANLLMNMIVNQ